MLDENERTRQYAKTRVSAEIKASGLSSRDDAYIDGRRFDLVAGHPDVPGGRFFVEILLQTDKYREMSLPSPANLPDPVYTVMVDAGSGYVSVPRALRAHIKTLVKRPETSEVL